MVIVTEIQKDPRLEKPVYTIRWYLLLSVSVALKSRVSDAAQHRGLSVFGLL